MGANGRPVNNYSSKQKRVKSPLAKRKNYLVTYDITVPKNLKRIFKVCSGFGTPLQYSVFWCQLTDNDLDILKERVRPLIGKEDQIIFFRLLEARDGRLKKGWMESMGKPAELAVEKFWVI